MDGISLLVALVALAIGGLIGWLFAGRHAGALKAERDGLAERFKSAVTDLAAEAEARKAADIQLASPPMRSGGSASASAAISPGYICSGPQ